MKLKQLKTNLNIQSFSPEEIAILKYAVSYLIQKGYDWPINTTELQDADSEGTANTVFIFQNDIYVAGGTNANGYGYWKNGVLFAFDDFSSTGIFVNTNGIYLSGCSYDGVADRYFSSFLKNNVKKFLLDEIHLPESEYLTCPYAIAAKGRSIVAGGYSGDHGVRYASIWGEDIISSLELGSTITSVALAENDIFTAGNIGNYEGGTAAIWINGIKKNLTIDSNPDPDIYTAGAYDAAYSIFVK